MVIDHINLIWFDHEFFPMLLIGRATFPLFCYAVAAAMLRVKAGFPRRYMVRMLFLAIVTQPLYQFAANDVAGNVIFTLAVGGLLAAFTSRLKLWQMYILYTGAIISMLWLIPLEFGLAGVMLPSAIVLAQRGHKGVYPFLLLLMLSINAGGILDWLENSVSSVNWLSYVLVCLSGIFLPLMVLDIARHLPQTGRLLPKYALHVFYPAHLVILKIIAMAFFK